MTAQVQPGDRVETIPVSQQPIIEGASGGSIAATSYVYRQLPAAVAALLPRGASTEIQLLHGPRFRFDILSTEDLAGLGISTVVCAADRAVYLFPAGSDYRTGARRVAAEHVEGLWVMPGVWGPADAAADAPARRPALGPTLSRARRQPPSGQTSRLTDRPIVARGRLQRRRDRASSTKSAAPPLPSPTDGLERADTATVAPQPATDLERVDAGVRESADTREQFHRGVSKTVTFASDAADATATTTGTSASTTTRKAQPTPIDYGEARQLLGNPTHRDTLTILRRAGRRPVNTDRNRARLDDLRARAVQMAAPMCAVPATGLERPTGEVITGDTLGGAMPLSAAGNRYCIVWAVASQPHKIFATFAPDHTAASSWAGFRRACVEAGIVVLSDAVSQAVQVVTDCGTEFQGDFDRHLAAAGILHNTSTPYKTKKHGAQTVELANRNLQRLMRCGLLLARANFEALGFDARHYWDYLAAWACRTVATRRRALANPDTTTEDTTTTAEQATTAEGDEGGDAGAASTDLRWAQIVRWQRGAFGSRCHVTVQPHDPKRSSEPPRQLADNSLPGLFLGLTANGRCRVLMAGGDIKTSTDVQFPVNGMVPLSGPPVYPDNDDWLLPFAAGLSDGAAAPAAAGTALPAPRTTPRTAPTPAATGTTAHPPGGGGGSGGNGGSRPAGLPLLRDDTVERVNITSGEFHSSAIPADPALQASNANHGGTAADAPTAVNHRPPTTAAPPGATGSDSVAPDGHAGSASNTAPTGDSDSQNTAADSDDADAAADPESFTDDQGKHVRVGDRVSVGWLPARGRRRVQYRGTVDAVSILGGSYTVRYDDGQVHEHPIDAAQRPPVLRRAPVLAAFDRGSHTPQARTFVTLLARRPAPAEAVRFALDPHGNVLRGYWDGSLTLGPEPAMPAVRAEDAPPDPTTVFEALAHIHAVWWLHAIIRERRGHLAPVNRPPTYRFTPRRGTGRRLMTKWVFVVKRRKADGSIVKFKARECIAGWHLRKGIDYVESYSGMTPWSDVLDLESLAAMLGLEVWEADLTQAYAFAPMPPTPSGDPVIAESCPGVQVREEDGTILNQEADQAWYGHPAAGYALAKYLHGALTGINPDSGVEVCPVPFVQNPFQPCMFQTQYPEGHPRHGTFFILHVSTDNLRTYGDDPAVQRDFMDWLKRNFAVTGGETSLRTQTPQDFMGCLIEYSADGSTIISMEQYIKALLHEVGMLDANTVSTPMAVGHVVTLKDAPVDADGQRVVIDHANKAFGTSYTQYADVMSFYGHLVSSIGWITHRVGPIMHNAHSVLCRVLSAPTCAGFQGVKRVLRYLAGKTDMARVYRRGPRKFDWKNGDWPAWSIDSDASYADDPHDRRGQGGYVGGYDGQAATTTTSKKTRRTCTSVDQAESDFAGSACKEAEYKRNWHGVFGIRQPGPTRLGIDNFATANRAGSTIRKWSPSSKQYDVNEKYLTECVERQVITVDHRPGSLPAEPRPGEGFRPDAMTKALPRAATEFYYDELHGRRPPPVGTDVVVDGAAMCVVTSPVHNYRSRFVGLVRVRYPDGRSYHVAPDRIALSKGEE